LSLSELPVEAARAVPRAFQFWLMVMVLVTLRLIVRLSGQRKAMAKRILAERSE